MSSPQTARRAAVALGVARAGFGAYLLAAPAKAGRSWFGSPPASAPTEILLRSVGARDLAIGSALARRGAAPGWLRAAAVSDLGDGLATLLAGSRLPKRNLIMGTAFAFTFGVAALAVDRLAGGS